MKSAEEWADRSVTDYEEGVSEMHRFLRDVQADALRHAAEIVNEARSSESDLRSVRDWIKAEAANLYAK